MERLQVSDGTAYEAIAGYSRAVRVGPRVYVAGTAPLDDDGDVVGPGNPSAQAARCIERIEEALATVGASLQDVVRSCRTWCARAST
jgi:enamine deaminase RidA (YjgF/YER057c/UK114 family)